ncbi:MAG: hypothetical protein ACD_5C00169G0004, partial [uncultured bacterium]
MIAEKMASEFKFRIFNQDWTKKYFRV